MRWSLVVIIATLLGCQREPREVKSARTDPFLAPSDVEKLPLEERDDPYTKMHIQPSAP